MTEADAKILLRRGLASFAKTFVGVKEVGGNNKGEFVQVFQKAVDNVAGSDPWCAAFVSYCLKSTERIFKESFNEPSIDFGSGLKLSESVCNFWFNNPESRRLAKPEVGALILWRRWANGKPTWQGHIGIIAEVVDIVTVRSIEGNTSSDSANERDGDGVFINNRNLTRNYGSLRPLGFLRTF